MEKNEMQAPDFEALLLFDREPDALQPEQVCQALAAGLAARNRTRAAINSQAMA